MSRVSISEHASRLYYVYLSVIQRSVSTLVPPLCSSLIVLLLVDCKFASNVRFALKATRPRRASRTLRKSLATIGIVFVDRTSNSNEAFHGKLGIRESKNGRFHPGYCCRSSCNRKRYNASIRTRGSSRGLEPSRSVEASRAWSVRWVLHSRIQGHRLDDVLDVMHDLLRSLQRGGVGDSPGK